MQVPPPNEDVVGRYEELRRQALGESGWTEQSLGWALFVRRGMAAWIQAVSTLQRPIDERRCNIHADNPVLSTTLQGEIAMVLAGMVIGHIEEGDRENACRYWRKGCTQGSETACHRVKGKC